jgi:hypothetical protein
VLREQDFAQDLTCIKVDEWRAVDTLNAEPELWYRDFVNGAFMHFAHPRLGPADQSYHIRSLKEVTWIPAIDD